MKFFTLVLLFSLVACSSRSLHTPVSRMISPETQGEFGKGSVEGRISTYGRDTAKFKNGANSAPLDPNGMATTLSAQGELGLLKRLDVYANPNFMLSAPNIYGLKYQILGQGRSEAKKGNFSLTVTGGYGVQHSGDNERDLLFGSWSDQDNIKSVSHTTKHREVGLVSGYRWRDNLLHYVSGFYFHQDIKSKVTTNDNTVVDRKYNFIQHGMIATTGLVYYMQTGFYLKGEFAYLNSDFSFGNPRYRHTLNAALGFTW